MVLIDVAAVVPGDAITGTVDAMSGHVVRITYCVP
jgi:hypothetical protein